MKRKSTITLGAIALAMGLSGCARVVSDNINMQPKQVTAGKSPFDDPLSIFYLQDSLKVLEENPAYGPFIERAFGDGYSSEEVIWALKKGLAYRIIQAKVWSEKHDRGQINDAEERLKRLKRYYIILSRNGLDAYLKSLP